MKVMVVDSAILFRQGFVSLLSAQPNIEVVAEVEDSWEAVVAARKVKPDLVILDPGVPTGNGLESLQQIKSEIPAVKCIVLSETVKKGELFKAFACGAQGYMLKNTPPDELFKAIKDVSEGKTAISFSMAGKLVQEYLEQKTEAEDPTGELTGREQEVLGMLGDGISNTDIAGRLNLSPSTVRHHVHSIVGKLGFKNRVGAAVFARSRKYGTLSRTNNMPAF